MAAGQYFQVEFRRCMACPLLHAGWCCGLILRCGKGGNRDADGRFRQQSVQFVGGEIGTHRQP